MSKARDLAGLFNLNPTSGTPPNVQQRRMSEKFITTAQLAKHKFIHLQAGRIWQAEFLMETLQEDQRL